MLAAQEFVVHFQVQSTSYFADDTNGKSRARKMMTPNTGFITQSMTEPMHFILEQFSQRLHQLEMMADRSPQHNLILFKTSTAFSFKDV